VLYRGPTHQCLLSHSSPVPVTHRRRARAAVTSPDSAWARTACRPAPFSHRLRAGSHTSCADPTTLSHPGPPINQALCPRLRLQARAQACLVQSPFFVAATEFLAAFLHRAVYQARTPLLHPPTARHSISPRTKQLTIAGRRHQPSRVPPPLLCLPRCPSVPATSHRPSTPSAPSAVPFSAELRGSLPSWLCFRPRALLQVMPCRRRLAVRNSSAESLLSLPELPPPSVPHQ
jgi:hypothetical protein